MARSADATGRDETGANLLAWSIARWNCACDVIVGTLAFES
jgi:hypothetical protein